MQNIKEKLSLFETHFHLSPTVSFEDYHNESVRAGVQYFLAAGSDLDSSFLAEKFAEKFQNAWFSAGIHPHDALQYPNSIQCFANFAKNKKCVAIGEIGLDYFYENSERNVQLKVFDFFLNMALNCNLPAIVHCRDKEDKDDAYKDAFSLLSDFAGKGGQFVIHCYTGNVEWAEKFMEIGAYLGITGIVTFSKARNIRDVVKIIPKDRILIETDTPYLAPVPKRGKTNHSKYLRFIAEKIAEEKRMQIKELAECTTANAKKLFLRFL